MRLFCVLTAGTRPIGLGGRTSKEPRTGGAFSPREMFGSRTWRNVWDFLNDSSGHSHFSDCHRWTPRRMGIQMASAAESVLLPTESQSRTKPGLAAPPPSCTRPQAPPLLSQRKNPWQSDTQGYVRTRGRPQRILSIPSDAGVLRSMLPLTSSKRFAALSVRVAFATALSAFSISALPKSPFPASVPATRSFNGLHPKSKLRAFRGDPGEAPGTSLPSSLWYTLPACC